MSGCITNNAFHGKVIIANKWPFCTAEHLKIWAGLGQNELLKRYPVYSAHYISDLELLSEFDLDYWSSCF